MHPVQLTLRNFMSYRDEATLDFAGLRVVCLAGDNGSGKSALLDAITWAIWGKTRASNDRDVIALGASEMAVTFVFRLREQEYRVYRRRSVGPRSGQSIEFDVRRATSDAWSSIAGDSVRATESKIVETLNLDYDTFVNSAFILQGRADSFTQKPPADRKRILADILNLGEYDDLEQDARAEERELRQQLASARSQIEALDRRLAERPACLAELERVTAALNDAGTALDTQRELARALNAALEAVERAERQLVAARGRLEREEANQALTASRIQAAEAERERHAAVLAQAAEIERGVAQFEQWHASATAMALTYRDVQAHIQARSAADRDIREAAAALRNRRDLAAARRTQAEAALERLARDDARLAELERAVADADEVLAGLEAARRALEDKRHSRSELHAENGQLRAQMDDIKSRLDALSTGAAECPVCRRSVSADEYEHLHAAWTSEGRALGDRFRANKEQMRVIEQEVVALAETERELEARDRENAAVRGTMAQLLAGQRDRDAYTRQAAEAEHEAMAFEAALQANDFAHAARELFAAAEAAIEALAYDEAAHRHADEQARAHEPYRARHHALETARERLTQVEEDLRALRGQLQGFEQTIVETRAEIAEHVAQLEGTLDLRARAQDANDACEKLERAKAEWQRQHGAAEAAISELDRCEREREELAAGASALALDLGALTELVQAFGKNGIQAMIVENILPELQDEANALLERMSSSHLQVAFKSQREALSSDKMIETLDIVIRDETGERPYALYSGGEAFRVNFAVRIALSKLLARRAGARVDVLVIDEGFGTQDAQGRDGLIEALRSVENDFQTIIVITHIGEIRELFPARIDITKTDRGSTISVN